MKIHNRSVYKLILSLLFLSVLLSGCAHSNPQSVSEHFDAYTETLFKEEICSNTINLHYTLAYPENYGIKEYQPTLGDMSVELSEQYTDDLLSIQKELHSFDYNALTREQQLTYDIMEDYLTTELSASELYLYGELLSPTTGYQAQLPILLAEYTFRTERDIEDYLSLTSQVDATFQSLLEYERAKSSAGLFMADFAVDDIISQMEAFIADPKNNYMIAVFNDKIDSFPGLDAAQRQQYKEQNHSLIIHSVVPAYQSLIDGLAALKGTGRNPGGLCYLPEGADYYAYLVKSNTGSSKTIPELKQVTENFIFDALDEMNSLVQNQPELLDAFSSYSFALEDPEAIIEDLIAKVGQDFPEPPAVDYTIKYVHESMAENSSPAFYLTPPIDDIQNNTIYINPHHLSDDIYTTIAHEGYPGHLYQTTYTSFKGLPLVRNLFSYSGYSEGWATYVEYYSYGISGLEENLAQILALNGAASLGLHAYVDLCVNYDGWDQQEVGEYLSLFGFTDEETAKEIFHLMVEEPANYLNYFIGYTEFLELREKARELCGNDFSLKEFHDVILTLGPAPFDILSEYMEDMLK